MTNKEREKLAQVIDAKYVEWSTRITSIAMRQNRVVDLIVQFDRPFKNQQQKKRPRVKP